MILSLRVLAALATVAVAGNDTCTTNSGRRWKIIAKVPELARPWIEEEGVRRAPYYIQRAMQLYAAAWKQKKGIDKSNDDPFIKTYEAQMHILAAVDLGNGDADTWIGAGRAALTLCMVDEEPRAMFRHALAFFAKGLRLNSTKLTELKDWTKKGDAAPAEKVPPVSSKLRERVGKEIGKWEKQVPVLPLDMFHGKDDFEEANSCANVEPIDSGSDAVNKAMASMQPQQIFPTTIFTANLADAFKKDWTQRVADLATKKYAEFGQLKTKANGGRPMDPNDLNDAFFSWQETSNSALEQGSHNKWPELYSKSKDFDFLRKVMKQALLDYARSIGVAPPPMEGRDKQVHDMIIWAAVYPKSGGRHGYHVHQSSLASCVIYMQTEGSKAGPIVLVDPRGAPPANDYEQHHGERDFEPQAPFHRSEYFFPEAGSLICFPSWLVHMVPKQRGGGTRVAFAANLQARGTWDAWQRTSVL